MLNACQLEDALYISTVIFFEQTQCDFHVSHFTMFTAHSILSLCELFCIAKKIYKHKHGNRDIVDTCFCSGRASPPSFPEKL